MQRACFRLRVRPDRLDEYARRHAAVRPEMLQALKESGWDNYSLFLGPEGTLIGYVEASDTIERAQARMDRECYWQAALIYEVELATESLLLAERQSVGGAP